MTPYDPDVLAPGLDVLFCGLNPGRSATVSGFSFAHGSNRFWPVLHLAGFTPRRLAPDEARLLPGFGCGITAVVTRATVRAEDVRASEFRRARPAFEAKVRAFAPRSVAFLGKRALAAMTGAQVEWGLQPDRFAGAVSWVLPNPSGLNRAFTLDGLVEAYSALRVALETPALWTGASPDS